MNGIHQKTVFFLFLLLLSGFRFPAALRGEESKLETVEEARSVTERQVREAVRSDSPKNLDGGYNAHQAVIDRFRVMRYNYTGGRYRHEPILFRLHVPDNPIPGKKYPLIIWLHGAGEGDMTNTRQLSHMQWGMDDFTGDHATDCYILATQCPLDNKDWTHTVENDKKGDAPLTITDEILSELLRTEPIDPDRISLFGICSGGRAAWEYAARYPGRFAAIAVCSTSPLPNVPPSRYAGTAVWAFNNKDDAGSDYRLMGPYLDSIQKLGGSAYGTIMESGGHNSWTPALKNENALAWLLTQNRARRSPPPGVYCLRRSASEAFLLFGIPAAALLILAGYRTRKWQRRFGALVRRRPAILLFGLFWLLTAFALAERAAFDLQCFYYGGTIVVRGEPPFDYLLRFPKGYTECSGKRPLLVFLHGAGTVGKDVSTLSQLDPFHYAVNFVSTDDYPFITVSPVTPTGGWKPAQIKRFVESLLADRRFRVRLDPERVYLTGFSMGGFGTFHTACSEPNLFAAFVPLAGGCDPADAPKLQGLSIWAFHGDADEVVDYESTQKIMAALGAVSAPEQTTGEDSSLSGKSPIKMTTLQGAGHGIPSTVYRRSDLYRWLLQCCRNKEQSKGDGHENE